MQSFMFQDEIDKLARQYFVDELGLDESEINEASQNLLGYFRTLHQIRERLEQEGAQL